MLITIFNQQVQEPQAPPPTLPPPVQKLPIPEQHIHLQTVFDALRAQCAQTTNNIVSYFSCL